MVVSSAVVGRAIFATLAKDPAIGWKIATGLLSVTAAVLASLQTFFRHEELAEKHRVAGAQYGAMKRDLDLIILELRGQDGTKRSTVLDQARAIFGRFNELEAAHPDVPDTFYDQASREQRADAEGI